MGLKEGSLPGFPAPATPYPGRSTDVVHLDGWHSYGKFARDPRLRLTPALHTFATLPSSGRYIVLRLASRFRDIYVCIYMGSVEVKVGKSFERFESLKFLRIFFSFSFFSRKQRCYLKFYMNELYIYQVIYEEKWIFHGTKILMCLVLGWIFVLINFIKKFFYRVSFSCDLSEYLKYKIRIGNYPRVTWR